MQCPFYWSDDCSLKGTKLWWFCQHGQGCPNNQNASTSWKTKMELWRRCQEGRRRPPCRVTNDPWLVMRPLLQQEGQSQEKSWDWTVTEQNPVWTPIQCRISTGQARNKQTNKQTNRCCCTGGTESGKVSGSGFWTPIQCRIPSGQIAKQEIYNQTKKQPLLQQERQSQVKSYFWTVTEKNPVSKAPHGL